MKMWVVNFAQEGSNITNHEYYSNENAANARVAYFEKRWFVAWTTETEILDEPRKGAPVGWSRWDGEDV